MFVRLPCGGIGVSLRSFTALKQTEAKVSVWLMLKEKESMQASDEEIRLRS